MRLNSPQPARDPSGARQRSDKFDGGSLPGGAARRTRSSARPLPAFWRACAGFFVPGRAAARVAPALLHSFGRMSTPALSTEPIAARPPRGLRWLFLAAVLLLGAAIYLPVRHFAFLNLDDPLFVSDNPWLAMGWHGARAALGLSGQSDRILQPRRVLEPAHAAFAARRCAAFRDEPGRVSPHQPGASSPEYACCSRRRCGN